MLPSLNPCWNCRLPHTVSETCELEQVLHSHTVGQCDIQLKKTRQEQEVRRGVADLLQATDQVFVRDKSFPSLCVLHAVRKLLVQLVDVRQHDGLVVPRTVGWYVGLPKHPPHIHVDRPG